MDAAIQDAEKAFVEICNLECGTGVAIWGPMAIKIAGAALRKIRDGLQKLENGFSAKNKPDLDECRKIAYELWNNNLLDKESIDDAAALILAAMRATESVN